MKASKAQLEANKRWYEKNKAKILSIQSDYRKSPQGKIVQAKKDKKTQIENPEKWAARNAVRRAINKGTLVKAQFCGNAGCGESNGLEAHHYLGYEKKNWLNIVYLCKKHQIVGYEDFSGEGFAFEGNPIFPCSCDRGKQITNLINSLK